MQNCILDMVKKHKLPLPSRLAYFDSDDYPIKYYSLENIDDKANDYEGLCDAKCLQLSCKIVSYQGKQMFEGKGTTAISLVLSTEPDMQVTYKAKLSISEYVAFIGSLLGLYLGFSLLGVFYVAIKFILTLSSR